MPTTVHLPQGLLKKIDGRAKALGISRNRFIVETLTEKLGAPAEWPKDFVQALKRPVTKGISAAAAHMEEIIRSSRRSRRAPPEL